MSEQRLIYLDNNATTRVAPRSSEACCPVSPSTGQPIQRLFARRRAGTADRGGARTRGPADGPTRTTSYSPVAARKAITPHCRSDPRQSGQAAYRYNRRGALGQHQVLPAARKTRLRGDPPAGRPRRSDRPLRLAGRHPAGHRHRVHHVGEQRNGVLFPIEEIAAICRVMACCFTRTQCRSPGRFPSTFGNWVSISSHSPHTSCVRRKASACST